MRAPRFSTYWSCATACCNGRYHRPCGQLERDELGATFPDQADTDALNFDNIGAQRDLDDKGEALAKTFGEALRRAEVPIGKVYTSKYNRAYETAVLAASGISRKRQI